MAGPLSTQETSTCDIREVLNLVADKWSLFVISQLGEGPRRFSEIKRLVEGISQRMLTVTLRRLERDGILTRTVYEVMPPHVAYDLTPLGMSLLRAAEPIIAWSNGHLTHVAAARAKYDASQRGQAADLGNVR